MGLQGIADYTNKLLASFNSAIKNATLLDFTRFRRSQNGRYSGLSLGGAASGRKQPFTTTGTDYS